jgi:hypothetical protein
MMDVADVVTESVLLPSGGTVLGGELGQRRCTPQPRYSPEQSLDIKGCHESARNDVALRMRT